MILRGSIAAQSTIGYRLRSLTVIRGTDRAVRRNDRRQHGLSLSTLAVAMLVSIIIWAGIAALVF